MKFKLLAGAALAAVFAATGASAQDTGWYGAVDLGQHWPEGMETATTNGSAYRWNFNQANDWAGFARLGYQFDANWRVEMEGGYRPGDLDSVRGNTANAVLGLCTPGVVRSAGASACGAPTGDMQSYSLMANLIYDIAPDAVISPFIGGGVGINHVKLETLGQFSNVPGAINAANPAYQNLTISDADTTVSWQLLGGLAWQATDRLNVDMTYRYIGGAEHEFKSTGSHALQPGIFVGEYQDQSVTVGLRYSFAAPPPPPPTARR